MQCLEDCSQTFIYLLSITRTYAKGLYVSLLKTHFKHKNTMKKVLFTVAAFAFALSVSAADNNPSKAVSMAAYKTLEAATIKLIVVNEGGENVTIRIRNAKGQVLRTDTVRNEERFSRKYIFSSDLQSGDYSIEVTNSKGTVSQSVTL